MLEAFVELVDPRCEAGRLQQLGGALEEPSRRWVPGEGGRDRYANRAVLFVESRWGKLRVQEDYEDTELVAAFDASTTSG